MPGLNRLRPFLLYTATGVLALALTAVLLRLWEADLRVPFLYQGDARVHSLCIKAVIERGWYLNNPSVGAPFGLAMHDFPMADGWHLLVMKLLALATSDWALVQNLYYLLTYPLTTLTSLYVLRRFGCSYVPALLGSLLYAFLPYHIMRGEGHFMLSAYYLVPLTVMLAVQVFLDVPFFAALRSDGSRADQSAVGSRQSAVGSRRAGLRQRPERAVFPSSYCLLPTAYCRLGLLAATVVCLAVGSSGVYYSFFGCFFLLAAGCLGAGCWRRLGPLVRAAALTGVLAASTFANLAPSLVYQWRQGPNPESSLRYPIQTEVLSLKPVQLILPTSGHRLPLLRDLKQKYNACFCPYVNENDCSALGLIGSVGLLLLFGRLVAGRGHSFSSLLEHRLAALYLAGLLLATWGGLGSLFALLVSPKIRCYNRISIYIGFLALFAVVLWAERLVRRAGSSRGGRLLAGALAAAVIALGLWDQVSPAWIPPYAPAKEGFESERQFVRQIEASVPEGAAIFQLPFMAFPEPLPVNQMGSYEPLRGYLHSRHLRWSYPCMKGRPSAWWMETVASFPADKLVEAVARAGFQGIYIDRTGFADEARELERNLAGLLPTGPLVSANGKWAFYTLAPYQDGSPSLPRPQGVAAEAPGRPSCTRMADLWR